MLDRAPNKGTDPNSQRGRSRFGSRRSLSEPVTGSRRWSARPPAGAVPCKSLGVQAVSGAGRALSCPSTRCQPLTTHRSIVRSGRSPRPSSVRVDRLPMADVRGTASGADAPQEVIRLPFQHLPAEGAALRAPRWPQRRGTAARYPAKCAAGLPDNARPAPPSISSAPMVASRPRRVDGSPGAAAPTGGCSRDMRRPWRVRR